MSEQTNPITTVNSTKGKKIYQIAREKAQEIIDSGFVDTPQSLDALIGLANSLGAGVTVAHIPAPNVSGLIVKEEYSDPHISIEQTDHPRRQRFTLAHEIGHLIDRQDFAHDSAYSFRDYRTSGNNNVHEAFANEFAGSLLMPEEEFLDCAHKNKDLEVANKFGVSLQAVNTRKNILAKTSSS